jgi:hypothetical protein
LFDEIEVLGRGSGMYLISGPADSISAFGIWYWKDRVHSQFRELYRQCSRRRAAAIDEHLPVWPRFGCDFCCRPIHAQYLVHGVAQRSQAHTNSTGYLKGDVIWYVILNVRFREDISREGAMLRMRIIP